MPTAFRPRVPDASNRSSVPPFPLATPKEPHTQGSKRAAHRKLQGSGTRRPHCGMAAAAAAAGVGFQLIGAAAATLLAAALVAAVLWRRRGPRPHAALVEGKPAPESGCGTGAAGDGGTDVIIVGAGVAGSALAYTLGKVVSFVSSSLLFPSLAWFH